MQHPTNEPPHDNTETPAGAARAEPRPTSANDTQERRNAATGAVEETEGGRTEAEETVGAPEETQQNNPGNNADHEGQDQQDRVDFQDQQDHAGWLEEAHRDVPIFQENSDFCPSMHVFVGRRGSRLVLARLAPAQMPRLGEALVWAAAARRREQEEEPWQ